MAHLLTKNEAASLLRISRRTLERWVRDGRLSVVKLSPGTVMLNPAEIDRLIAESTTEAAAS